MITILSPAKTLNMEKATNTDLYTRPMFIKEALLSYDFKNIIAFLVEIKRTSVCIISIYMEIISNVK